MEPGRSGGNGQCNEFWLGPATARGTAVTSLAGKAGSQFDAQLAVLVGAVRTETASPGEKGAVDVSLGRFADSDIRVPVRRTKAGIHHQSAFVRSVARRRHGRGTAPAGERRQDRVRGVAPPPTRLVPKVLPGCPGKERT